MSPDRIGLDELTAVLRRWFFADDLTEADTRRLHAQWLELASNDARVRGQDHSFEPRNRVAFGHAWWEERQQGRRGTVWPEDPLDRLKMFLTCEGPPAGPMPRPRPYCPPQLVGRWRFIGASPKLGGEVVAASGTREWLLTSDGRLSTVGDPERDGRRWWAHRGPGPDELELWIGATSPRGDVERWGLLGHRGDEMDLYGPETPGGFMRWRRIEEEIVYPDLTLPQQWQAVLVPPQIRLIPPGTTLETARATIIVSPVVPRTSGTPPPAKLLELALRAEASQGLELTAVGELEPAPSDHGLSGFAVRVEGRQRPAGAHQRRVYCLYHDERFMYGVSFMAFGDDHDRFLGDFFNVARSIRPMG